jgi:pseudaminic acid cytidylyltransferase
MSRVLAIIPARGGSRRIPDKNIRLFHGRPIIEYSIEAAVKAGVFDVVMVSTENDEIARLAKKAGAQVPFMRSLSNASDTAGLADVVLEVLATFKEQGHEFDFVCCILATAPFIKSHDLAKACSMLDDMNVDAVVSVVRSSYPVEQSLQVIDNKLVISDLVAFGKRTQDCRESFFDTGLFYFVRVSEFLKFKKLFLPKTAPFFVHELASHDIDTMQDWTTAELKYKLISEK